ncbi:FAD-dependent monooxygenase [Saprospiraceae bacterium]|nr:FAD-dependent monooxygenase [Saprospiraceae bacterium]
MNVKEQEKYSLVIIGAGPAGLSMAITVLQAMDISVLIVEGKGKNRPRIGESCPPELVILMAQLGTLESFKNAGHHPSPGYSSVWGRADIGHNDSIVSPLGPNWCLDREKFDEMLEERAESLKGNISWNTRFIQMNQEENGDFQIDLKDEDSGQLRKVFAHFVVDASGVKARAVKALGVHKKVEDTLFAHIRFAEIIEGKMSKRVQLEATNKGWWYQASLPRNNVVSMMITHQNQIKELQRDESKAFDKALAKTSFIAAESKKVKLTNCTYRTWPVYSGILDKIEGENWLAIGDAAASYDPIMARGIYKGLSDGIKGANKVLSFFRQDGKYDHGSFSSHVQKNFKQYRKNRLLTYAIERRWLNDQFWKDRLAGYDQ